MTFSPLKLAMHTVQTGSDSGWLRCCGISVMAALTYRSGSGGGSIDLVHDWLGALTMRTCKCTRKASSAGSVRLACDGLDAYGLWSTGRAEFS